MKKVRYLYDETYSSGAQHLRTRHFQGAALFQFLVATTNNLLRWMQLSVSLRRLGGASDFLPIPRCRKDTKSPCIFSLTH